MDWLWLIVLILVITIAWMVYLIKGKSEHILKAEHQNKELQQEKYLLEFLMENLPISIYFKDTQSRFIKVSKHMTMLFHKEMKDMIGKTDFDVQDERHAREAFEDEQVIMRTFRSKINFLEREIHQDGTESWVSTTKMPLLNQQGEVIGTLGISKDISEVKKQNKELLLNEEKIRAQNLKLQEQQEELHSQNEELIQTQEEIYSQRDITAEQNQRIIEAAAIIQKQNEIIQLRNENLEEEIERRTKDLVEYNQQLEQFAFITAHNVRSPVARILGLGNILNLPNQSKEEQAFALEKLALTANELDQVIRDLNIILEVKKSLTQVRTKVHFQTEFEKVLSNLKTEMEDTNAIIKSDFTRAPTILSFSPYVDSILYNLISNAIKYHHPERQPVINVNSLKEGEHTIVTVSDNGLGVDIEKYGHQMFTLYKRFHNHTEGRGMGLYLVKSQVTTLGGHIQIKSEPNNGTTMIIYFKS